MSDIQWDAEASLMRVNDFATADTQEERVASGTVRALVGQVLDLPYDRQSGLMIRTADADDVAEYDTDAIRELAAHPGFTGAHGADDTADLADDPDVRASGDEETLIGGDVSGPSETDGRGMDGEK